METKIKVVDRTNIVERLEPGDIVKKHWARCDCLSGKSGC